MEIKPSPDYSTTAELVGLWKGVRRELLDFFSSLSEDDFIQKKTNGWSFSEVGEHLYLSQLPVGVIVKKILKSDSPVAPVPDYAKLIYETLNKKGIKNPEFVQPGRNDSKAEVIEALNRAESKMIRHLSDLKKEELLLKSAEHPVAGQLNLFDWIWLMILHEARHLKFMQERLQ